MNTARRIHRTRVTRRVRRTVWPLCFAACTITATAARAAHCVDLRGGELLLSASEGCVTQMRQDGVRRQVARQIGSQVGSGSTLAVQAAPPARPAPRETTRGRTHGLDHPLARLSMLNAQSRYLWSLGNPASTYYGQAQSPTQTR